LGICSGVCHQALLFVSSYLSGRLASGSTHPMIETSPTPWTRQQEAKRLSHFLRGILCPTNNHGSTACGKNGGLKSRRFAPIAARKRQSARGYDGAKFQRQMPIIRLSLICRQRHWPDSNHGPICKPQPQTGIAPWNPPRTS
jgi:hypothetical protein